MTEAAAWLDRYGRFWDQSFDHLERGCVTDELNVGIHMTRVFDAPRQRVWAEWTDPEAFADWFGGPECEVPLASVSMDVRPGGAWKLTMYAPPNRRRIDWWGEYREVEEPERLVFTISDRPDPGWDELVTVVLNDLGEGRTEMLFEQRGRMEPDQYEAAETGWSGFFDRMVERLR